MLESSSLRSLPSLPPSLLPYLRGDKTRQGQRSLVRVHHHLLLLLVLLLLLLLLLLLGLLLGVV